MPLNENEVVKAVCQHLRDDGFQIDSSCTTSQRGIDVEATHSETGVKVLVEAKGSTSARLNSPRSGNPFSPEQVLNRVAKGVFTCLQLRAKNPDKTKTRVLLAVPEQPNFRAYIDSIKVHLDVLGIETWFAP